MNPPPSPTGTQETSREVPAGDEFKILQTVSAKSSEKEPAPQPVIVPGDDDHEEPISLEAVLRKQMEEFRTRSVARNTVRAYESDWRDFEASCGRQKRFALPADAETLCLYLVDCAQRREAHEKASSGSQTASF